MAGKSRAQAKRRLLNAVSKMESAAATWMARGEELQYYALEGAVGELQSAATKVDDPDGCLNEGIGRLQSAVKRADRQVISTWAIGGKIASVQSAIAIGNIGLLIISMDDLQSAIDTISKDRGNDLRDAVSLIKSITAVHR